MFEGIYIWDAKYGVPNDSDYESVQKFVSSLEGQPQEINNNLSHFSQELDAFLEDALKYYSDDPILNLNKGFSRKYSKDTVSDILIYLDDNARECHEYFEGVLYYLCYKYNMVYCDGESGSVTQPHNQKQANSGYAKWQKQRDILNQEPDTETDTLPDNKKQMSTLMANILKEQFKVLAIKAKIKKVEGVIATIPFGKDYLKMNLFFEQDLEESLDFNLLGIWLKPTIYVYVAGAGNTFLKYSQLTKAIPKHSYSTEREIIHCSTITELKQYMQQCVDLLMYFYPHMTDLNSLYSLLANAENDRHLSRHMFNETFRHIDPCFVYNLAIITKQPNLSELRKHFKQLHVDNEVWGYECRKKIKENREITEEERIAEIKQSSVRFENSVTWCEDFNLKKQAKENS